MRPIALYTIVALNIVMFFVVFLASGDFFDPSAATLFRFGGSFPPVTLDGEAWRLLSSMFLHAGVLHIGFNMYCLLQGSILERYYGSFGFVVLYLVSGLFGGVASLIKGTPAVSIGASGAVFGIFGALFVVIYQRRAALGPELTKRQLTSLGQFFALNFVIGFAVPSIDMAAHLGGLVAGAIIALLMLPVEDPNARKRTAIIGAGGLGLTAVSLISLSAMAG